MKLKKLLLAVTPVAVLSVCLFIASCGGGGGGGGSTSLPPFQTVQTTATAQSAGFTVNLQNYASIAMGQNALPDGTNVVLTAQQQPAVNSLYQSLLPYFGYSSATRSPFEVTVSTSSYPFNSSITANITLPKSLATFPVSSLIALVSDEEVTDLEDDITLSPVVPTSLSQGVLTVAIPRSSFIYSGGNYIATILIISPTVQNRSQTGPPTNQPFISGCPAPLTVPVKASYRISSPFGPRIHPIYGTSSFHTGVDFAPVPAGSNPSLYAAADGVVVYAGTISGYGNVVTLKHTLANGTVFYTRYCHLQSPSPLRTGDSVTGGTTIVGVMGQSGGATGVHLHFEVMNSMSADKHTPNSFYDPADCLQLSENIFTGLWSGSGTSNEGVTEQIAMQVSETNGVLSATVNDSASNGNYAVLQLSGTSTDANKTGVLTLASVTESNFTVCDGLEFDLSLSSDNNTLTAVIPAGSCVGGTYTLTKATQNDVILKHLNVRPKTSNSRSGLECKKIGK